MVRSAVADESFLSYLTNLANPGTCTVGLILGQPTSQKDYIIHFAKTPQCQGDIDKEGKPYKIPAKFTDILDAWVADHAKHVTRMLPGGMYVLGVFVVSQEDILTPFSSKIKTMLLHMHKHVGLNKFFYGNSDSSEKLVLNYCAKTNIYNCKSYNTATLSVQPAEIKFQPNLTIKWLQLECKYELEQTFPIIEEHCNWALRKHMQDILTSINDNFKSAIFMFDGEIKTNDDFLETVGKKRKMGRKSGHHDSSLESKPMQVTILLPCESKGDGQITLHNCSGQIKLFGHVGSKLWLHPKATANDASKAVVQDLVRSLAARLEMHWDSLIEEEHGSPEDTNSIHEPPRRVLVTLPTSKVTLSDYLFPGEGSQEAQISIEELLDIPISDQEVIKDIEGQAELSDLYNQGIEDENHELFGKVPETTNTHIYFVGLIVAFLVLVISLLCHVARDYV